MAFSILFFIIAPTYVCLCFRDACGIQHDDVFIIIGGRFTLEIVSRYNVNGWVEDLPKLRTGRRVHGCGHFFSETKGLVKIIIIKMKYSRGRDKTMVMVGMGYSDQPLFLIPNTVLLSISNKNPT